MLMNLNLSSVNNTEYWLPENFRSCITCTIRVGIKNRVPVKRSGILIENLSLFDTRIDIR
jgi:hypothetical protein